MSKWIKIVNKGFSFDVHSLTTAYTICPKGAALSINLAHISRVVHVNETTFIFDDNDRLIASCEEKTFIEAAKNATDVPV